MTFFDQYNKVLTEVYYSEKLTLFFFMCTLAGNTWLTVLGEVLVCYQCTLFLNSGPSK